MTTANDSFQETGLSSHNGKQISERVAELMEQMTIEEKIGQMSQVNGHFDSTPEHIRNDIVAGKVGSLLNVENVDVANELQCYAVNESRLGIPLLIGRDVIHGFKTVFPIPLGQAASWNPSLITRAASVAAMEAAAAGINWTFAPMVDISRDPRWGRIAESLGEDPFLCSKLAVAMIMGFQGMNLNESGSIAACVKHFAGYGASEAGRDYNTTNIPERELRDVYFQPFKAAVDAGVATIMTSFSDLNGIPASGNEWLLKEILREEWGFEGFVISDWESISELAMHGLTADARESALAASKAGVDMEMASTTYRDHLANLVSENQITIDELDGMVANILAKKFELGLFDQAFTDTRDYPAVANTEHLNIARQAALESLVLLRNENHILPIDVETVGSLAIIGPLADEPYEQLGTWVFDGDPDISQTPLTAIQNIVGDHLTLHVAPGLTTTRSRDGSGFEEAVNAARESDVVLLFLGEESILSGEAHCRADISLPGAQEELLEELVTVGKPIVVIIQAGRPLTIEYVAERADAILYAWHPGTMGGPAIIDVLFGEKAPSGKLPVTFPRMVGQVPIYYAHKNTGRPSTSESFLHIDNIKPRAAQTSTGNTSFHMDAGFTPLYPFGFGLTYTELCYENIRIDRDRIPMGSAFEIHAELINKGEREANEVVQLYVRDLVGSVTRPVRELKGFQRAHLKPGEQITVSFALTTDDLAFHGRDMLYAAEPGKFHAWIGGSSEATLQVEFELIEQE